MREDIRRMMAARDRVDEKFMAYATEQHALGNNLEALSKLAIIGGRLDKIIRDQIALDRKSAYREIISEE